MKEFCKSCKRVLAMFLAVVMLLSAANVGIFAPTYVHAVEPEHTVTLGVLIKENFGDELNEEEVSIITSGYLSADKTYPYEMPGDDDELITVDEKEGKVTAKKYTDPEYGTQWIPVSFDLTDGTNAITGYDDLPLQLSGDVFVGTYELEENNPGNSFTVEVTYSLDLTMTGEDKAAQQEMLDAARLLAADIVVMKQLNAVGIVGDDQDLKDKILELAGDYITNPDAIYANTILDFMTVELEELGENTSPVDLIYSLVEGITVPVITDIDFNNKTVTTHDEVIKFVSPNAIDAAESMYAQQEKAGQKALDLSYFLSSHHNASYLEMLVAHGAQLEAALTGNYEEMEYLYRFGLPTVSEEFGELLTQYKNVNSDIYDDINAYLAEQNLEYTVESVQDLKDMAAELGALDDEAYTEINNALQNMDQDIKDQLEGLPEQVTGAEELDQLKNAIVNAYNELIDTINEELEPFADQLPAGTPAQVRKADTSSYDAFVASGDKDIEDLTAISDALDDIRQDALDSADKKLQEMWDNDAFSQYLEEVQAPTQISSEEDIEDLRAALVTVKANVYRDINAKLEEMYTQAGDMAYLLEQSGVPRSVSSVEELNGEQLAANLEVARVAMSDKMQGMMNDALEDAHSDMFQSAILEMAGVPKKINSEKEMRDLVARLNKPTDLGSFVGPGLPITDEQLADLNKGIAALDQMKDNTTTVKDGATAAVNAINALDEADVSLGDALDALDTLNKARNAFADAKAAVKKVKPYIGDVLNAQEQIAKLNDTYLPLLNEAVAGLEKLEDGIKLMEEKKVLLDLLVQVMERFCKTVEPIYDAFENNSWNAPKLLNTAKEINYTELEANVLAAGNQTHTAKDTLHVATAVVRHKLDMYDVTVSYEAVVIDPAKADSLETLPLNTVTHTVTLTKGATAADILAEIADKINEKEILEGWAISADHYDRSTTTLPEELTENITYTISYAPKLYTVTFGDGFAAGTAPVQVPYGYRMTLPVNEDVTAEYTYTVNGTDNIDQGTVVTIIENTAISREEGAISEKQYLTDLVVNTNPGMDALEKSILLNQALNRGQAISIRVPGKDQVTVSYDGANGATTITAKPYFSRVGDKYWNAAIAMIDGVSADMVNGVHVETQNPGFDKVVVNYELAITAADLGITDEQLLAAMNIPYELVSDYDYQKAALDALSTDDASTGMHLDNIMGQLTRLNDYEIVTENPKLTLRQVLANIRQNNESMGFNLSPEALNAVDDLYDLIPATNGHIDLYNTLVQYKSQGMLHYYRNEQTYINQITQLNGILTVLMADQGFKNQLNASQLSIFDAIHQVLSNAAALAQEEYGINKTLINLSSPYLNALLTSLEAADIAQLTEYTSVPSAMVWTASVEQPGPSKLTVTMTVDLNGAQKTDSKMIDINAMMTYTELTAWAQSLVKELGLKDEVAQYYAASYSFTGDTFFAEDTALTATWALKSYEVKVDGNVVGAVTYEDRFIKLEAHEEPENYQYEYYINNVYYAPTDKYELTDAQFQALTEDNLVITRKTVDLRERALIKLVDSMNGAAVLTKDANGEYAIILRVDPDTVKEDMTDVAIGLFLTEYKYIGLDGNVFFDGSKYRLQAAVDAALNSGVCTDSLLELIDENGNIREHLVLENTTQVLNTVQPDYLDSLGGVVMQTVADFGAAPENTTPAKLYITLADSVDRMATARKALLKLKEAGITFDLNNGRANLNVDLPEQAYGAYLAALSLVGEVDIHNVNDVNAQIAMGYVQDLLEPAIGKDITVETYENTFAQFGKDVDLSRFSRYFELFQNAYHTVGITYEEDTGIAAVENISINAAISKLQSVVDGMELPEGISVDLSKLIYEYDDPATDADDATSGVGAAAALKWENLSRDYAAMFLDIRADGVLNKLGMWTEEELIAASDDFAGISVLILLDDVQGDLTINTTTLLDLNGKTINGNITGGEKANLIIIDNAYEQAIPGGVTGTVSGNVTILDGKYAGDVSDFMDNGYVQGDDGVVYNKLYRIVADEDGNVTVTLNATPGEVRDLISKKGIVELAMEMAAGLVLNNYNKASLFIENGKVFNPKISDVIGLFASDNKINAAIDTGLSWVSASDLTDIINMFIDDLTDFAAIETALATGDKLATYTFSTAPWELEIVHIADGDYLSMSVGASDKTEDVSLSIIVDGSVIDEAGKLVGALADTVTVDVEANMDDIVRDENNVINISGSFKGVIDIDFTEDPSYVIMMAAILADGADATLKAKLEAGIEQFYTENSTGKLESTFRGITIKQLCDSLGNHNRNDNFASIVKGLDLTADTKTAILKEIDNDEMGYHYVIDAIGIALKLLQSRNLLDSVTEREVVLGTFENKDEISYYYGFTRDAHVEGIRNVFRSYKLGYDLDVSQLSVKVRLFLDHVHSFEEIVDDAFLKAEATCTTQAEYYLSCAYCGIAHSEKTFFYGDLEPHDYQKTVDDKYLKEEATCTTQAEYYLSCSVCGEAHKTETFFHGELKAHNWVNVEHQDYWISDPTCTEGAKYYKSCSVCGEKGTETFTVGSGFGHTPTATVAPEYLKSKANCSNYAVYYKHCPVCNEKLSETFEDVEGGYGDHVTQWKYDKVQHWEECQYCDYTTEKVDHRFGEYENDYECVDCGYIPQVETKVVSWAFTDTDITTGLIQAGFGTVALVKDELMTAISSSQLPQGVLLNVRDTYHAEVRLKYTLNGVDWITADQNHFPEDGRLLVEMDLPAGVDPEIYDIYAAHMFAVDAFGKYAGEVEFPEVTVDNGKISFYVTGLSPVLLSWVCKTNHAETEIRDAVSAGCTNGYTGDTYCKNCGKLLELGTIIPGSGHKDENGDGFCDICGEDMNASCEHTHYIIDPNRQYLAEAATCTSPAKYYKICVSCGVPSTTETFTYGDPLPHNFIVDPNRQYLAEAATCTSPAKYYKICSAGGEPSTTETFTYGDPLPHEYVVDPNRQYLAEPATCTSPAKYYKICSVGGEPSTTETFTYGDPLNHNFVEDPNRQYLAEPATCTSPAKYYKICSVGGEPSTTETFTYGDPLNHNFVEDPNLQYPAAPASCTSGAKYYKICSVGGEPSTTETFTVGNPLNHNFVEDPNRQYLAEAATCTSPAKYYKICSVGGEPSTTETFTYGDPLPHNYVEVVAEQYLKTPATTTSPAVYYHSCSVCGEKGTTTFTYGEPLGGQDIIPVLGVPNIPVGGNVYGFLVDTVNNILLVDTAKNGLTVDQFISVLQVAVTNDADNKAAIVVSGIKNNLVCTTSKVTLTAESATGNKVSATYDIVIIGDTNCNGRIESGDAVKVDRHYRGQITMVGLEFLAADTNRNSRLESGDAVKIMTKYQNSSRYVTALVK